MKLPFTIEQFLDVFRQYNENIYPLQFVFYALAFLVVILIAIRTIHSARIIFFVLAFFWLWMGLVYHVKYFTSINKAAYLFGVVFIFQGLLILIKGVFKKSLSFSSEVNRNTITGGILILLSLIIYPLLSYYNGHDYPFTPSLGLPCPSTIFTFGVLCFVNNKAPLSLWLIPLLWTLIGFSAAFTLGMKEDYLLLVAGILAFSLVFINSYRSSPSFKK
jgi:Family of unknown function (DUF6064)